MNNANSKASNLSTCRNYALAARLPFCIPADLQGVHELCFTMELRYFRNYPVIRLIGLGLGIGFPDVQQRLLRFWIMSADSLGTTFARCWVERWRLVNNKTP